MFFDLNLPISKLPSTGNVSRKGKEQQGEQSVSYSAVEIAALEKRLDLLDHCSFRRWIISQGAEWIQVGYTVIAFSQTVKKRVDPKTHVNTLNSLVDCLRVRPGIVYLKRLNIILDQDSEKGFGLVSHIASFVASFLLLFNFKINANVSLFNSYDLISLIPTTHACFTLACLTHSLPSNLTAHIISLPLTLPRLPYHLKHTVVRTAIKNGAVFEMNYVGAIGGENDPLTVDANVAESGSNAKRNWWASARELVRVTKGKGLLVSGGVFAEADHRAPRDIANLYHSLPSASGVIADERR